MAAEQVIKIHSPGSGIHTQQQRLNYFLIREVLAGVALVVALATKSLQPVTALMEPHAQHSRHPSRSWSPTDALTSETRNGALTLEA